MDEDMMTGISMVVVLRGGVENIFETNQNSWDYIVFLGCGRAIIPNLEFFISGGKNPLLEKSILGEFYFSEIHLGQFFWRNCCYFGSLYPQMSIKGRDSLFSFHLKFHGRDATQQPSDRQHVLSFGAGLFPLHILGHPKHESPQAVKAHGPSYYPG
jgi:hypothetical protein